MSPGAGSWASLGFWGTVAGLGGKLEVVRSADSDHRLIAGAEVGPPMRVTWRESSRGGCGQSITGASFPVLSLAWLEFVRFVFHSGLQHFPRRN